MIDEQAEEASGLAEHCYFEGCQEWITGSSDYCPKHAKAYAPEQAGQSTPAPTPREWYAGDPEPIKEYGRELKVRDQHGDVWTYNDRNGRWYSPETQPFGWETIARKWGPLTEVVPPSSVSPSGENTTPVGAEGQDDSSTAQGACEPFCFCGTHWTPEQQREAEIRQLAFCEASVQASVDPEDGEQCPEPRQRGSVYCERHTEAYGPESVGGVSVRLPLPDSETEWRCSSTAPDSYLIPEDRRCQLVAGHVQAHTWADADGQFSSWAREVTS